MRISASAGPGIRHSPSDCSAAASASPPSPPVSSPTAPPERPTPAAARPHACSVRTADPRRHQPPRLAAATPQPLPTTAPLSPSSDRNSSPCASMRSPSPWCRPTPRDPASPAPPAGTTPIPAGTGPTAYPDCPCGSPRLCGNRACCSLPVPGRLYPRGDAGRFVGRTPPRRSSRAAAP